VRNNTETPKAAEEQPKQPMKVEAREFTAELVNKIISDSMAHKAELHRYLAPLPR
jgi:hypothetical protein